MAFNEIPFELTCTVASPQHTWKPGKKGRASVAQGLVTIAGPDGQSRTFTVPWWVYSLIQSILNQIESIKSEAQGSEVHDALELGVLYHRCRTLDGLAKELHATENDNPTTYQSIRACAILMAGNWGPDWLDNHLFLKACHELDIVPFCEEQFGT